MIRQRIEKGRKLAEKHHLPRSHQVIVSNIIKAPVSLLYYMWKNDKARNQWMSNSGIIIRKASRNHSLCMVWLNNQSGVEVYFFPLGDNECQVTVQHNQIPDLKEELKMREFWSKSLERLDIIMRT
ncbi:MAG: SRPBCC domain-containing protein [Chloroflexota bacterium]